MGFNNNSFDISNYYTKSETDTLLDGKVDNSDLNNYYTKSETNTLLDGKVDNSDLNNYYTKTITDLKLSDKLDVDTTLDQIPVAIGNVNIGNNRLINVSDPINSKDVVNKEYFE